MKYGTGIIIATIAFLGGSYVGYVGAETLPRYPVNASRMSLEGFTNVKIDCATKKVEVVAESNKYFATQVRRDVWQICYGQSAVIARNYVFKMSNKLGAHDVLVTQPGRSL